MPNSYVPIIFEWLPFNGILKYQYQYSYWVLETLWSLQYNEKFDLLWNYLLK